MRYEFPVAFIPPRVTDRDERPSGENVPEPHIRGAVLLWKVRDRENATLLRILGAGIRVGNYRRTASRSTVAYGVVQSLRMQSTAQPAASPAASDDSNAMNAFLLSFLLLSTIVVAFVFGIATGYWVICGILNFFDPAHKQKRPAPASALATTASGD